MKPAHLTEAETDLVKRAETASEDAWSELGRLQSHDHSQEEKAAALDKVTARLEAAIEAVKKARG